MSFDQIKGLEIPANPDGCVIWLWFTNNHFLECAELIRHWGRTQLSSLISHKGILTWEKITSTGVTRLGVGHWLRNSTEHCAICTIGKVASFAHQSALARKTPNLIKAPRREHSRKPEEFYNLVEQLCLAPRLDMFARQTRSGWDSWGDQTNFFDKDVAIG